jgi:hypothetical protein
MASPAATLQLEAARSLEHDERCAGRAKSFSEFGEARRVAGQPQLICASPVAFASKSPLRRVCTIAITRIQDLKRARCGLDLGNAG